MSRYETGLIGEQTAERWLCERGMRCVARRFRAADGEIDLVMLDGDAVVFVEVKSRPSQSAGTGLMAVTPAKRRRMIHAATVFLMKMGWMDKSVRFDVVEMSADGILHVPNAFSAMK